MRLGQRTASLACFVAADADTEQAEFQVPKNGFGLGSGEPWLRSSIFLNRRLLLAAAKVSWAAMASVRWLPLAT